MKVSTHTCWGTVRDETQNMRRVMARERPCLCEAKPTYHERH
jgi:hypothetical protein